MDFRSLAGPARQVGFFDQFTVTFSRNGLQLAVEPAEAFDERYGAVD